MGAKTKNTAEGLTPAGGQSSTAVLVATIAANFFANIDRHSFSLLLEPIKADLGANDTQMGMLSGLAFVLFYSLFGLPMARWADIGVRKHILVGSLAVWSMMTAFCGAAGSVLQMAIARAGLGIGEAGAAPASLSMLADCYPRARRHQAISLFQVGASLAPVAGIPIVAAVSASYGWRIALISLGVVGISLAAFLLFALKEPPRGRFDEAHEPGEAPPSFRRTMKVLLSSPGYTLHLASHTFATSAIGILMVWLGAYMMRGLGLSLSQAGLVVGINGLAMCASIVGGGWICARAITATQNDRWVVAFCTAVTVVAATGVFFLMNAPTLTTFLVVNVFVHLVLVARAAPSMTLATELAPPRMRALSASLIIGLPSLVGSGLAPVLTGRASDFLATNVGAQEGLRLAILYTTMPCYIVSIILGLLAMRFIGNPLGSRRTHPSPGV